MTALCVQSDGKGGKPQATRSATRVMYPRKGILKERTPPHWGRMQGPRTTRLTQLRDILSSIVGSGGVCPSP
jgi:hypothetical protein